MIAAGLLLVLFSSCLSASQTAPSLPRITDLSTQDTLAKAGISAAQQSEVAKLIEENSADWERTRIAQMRARRVSLSPGKMDGLVLHATALQDCGGTGNCMLTVLRQQGSEWQVVLGDTFSDGFGFSRTAHNGVYDLALSANESAESSSVTVLAFDGSRYRTSKCYHVVRKGAEKAVTLAACAKAAE